MSTQVTINEIVVSISFSFSFLFDSPIYPFSTPLEPKVSIYFSIDSALLFFFTWTAGLSCPVKLSQIRVELFVCPTLAGLSYDSCRVLTRIGVGVTQSPNPKPLALYP